MSVDRLLLVMVLPCLHSASCQSCGYEEQLWTDQVSTTISSLLPNTEVLYTNLLPLCFIINWLGPFNLRHSLMLCCGCAFHTGIISCQSCGGQTKQSYCIPSYDGSWDLETHCAVHSRCASLVCFVRSEVWGGRCEVCDANSIVYVPMSIREDSLDA
jgi:hypothetical protein